MGKGHHMVYTESAAENGKIIKGLRLRLGLNQNALANGICSQSYLSKIESGKEVPSSAILNRLSTKLRVDLEHLFDESEKANLNYRNNIKSIIQSFIQDHNYEQVLKIVKYECHLFNSPEEQQFLLWANAISLYYSKKDLNATMMSLKTALRKTCTCLKSCSVQELTIMNSIGIILSESKRNRQALKILKWACQHINKHDYIEDITLPIKNIYALARSLSRNHEYDHCIRLCNAGIEQCLHHHSIYLMGELYYERGLNHYFLNQPQLTLQDFEQAIMFFTLTKRYDFKDFVENKIKEFQLR